MLTTPIAPITLAELFPRIERFGKVAIRLHPRRDAVADSRSKLGGVFYPFAENWPICLIHQKHLVPVLQVHAEDVPEFVFPTESDLLQLFWCPYSHRPDDAPLLQIIWRSWREIDEPTPENLKRELADSDLLVLPCRLNPEKVIEYPASEVLAQLDPQLWEKIAASTVLAAIAEANDMEDAATAYDWWLSVAPGTKLGGYPHWIQRPETPLDHLGREMEYLLTIDSAECDAGTWQRWLPHENRSTWESGDYDLRNAFQCPTGIMLGDMGNLHVFVSKDPSDCTTRWVYQCT